jgi:O-acetyl-ADP-ribose deacetylase (regulator of RNase III)
VVTYVKGDATKPVGDGPKIIAHICNDSGGWGAGFVKAVSRRWPEPEYSYRRWHRGVMNDGGYFLPLGHVQMVRVSDELEVANMVAQHGMVSPINPHPISYAALGHCLTKVASIAAYGSSVHMPRIGTGLAQGDWEVIESIINRTLTLRDVDVTVYDL